MLHHKIDLTKLMTDGDIESANTIWLVEFRGTQNTEETANEPAICPDCGLAHDPHQFEASITVLGGSDAQQAINKARDHAIETGTTDFQLRGVRPLAEADLL